MMSGMDERRTVVSGMASIDEFNSDVIDEAWTRPGPEPWWSAGDRVTDYPPAMIRACLDCNNWTLEIRGSITYDELDPIIAEHQAECPGR